MCPSTDHLLVDKIWLTSCRVPPSLAVSQHFVWGDFTMVLSTGCQLYIALYQVHVWCHKWICLDVGEIWQHEGRRSRSLHPRRGTRGLWSISISMCFPMIKSTNFLQTHVVAKASFSTWVYRCFVSDIDWEAFKCSRVVGGSLFLGQMLMHLLRFLVVPKYHIR